MPTTFAQLMAVGAASLMIPSAQLAPNMNVSTRDPAHSYEVVVQQEAQDQTQGDPTDPLVWMEQHHSELASHGGRWLVLSRGPSLTLVGYADSLANALTLAQKNGVEEPFVFRIPPADLPTLIF